MISERNLYEIRRSSAKKQLLTRFILIGSHKRVGIYASLVGEKLPLDSLDCETLKKVVASEAFFPKPVEKCSEVCYNENVGY